MGRQVSTCRSSLNRSARAARSSAVVEVAVHSSDPVSRLGVARMLAGSARFRVVDGSDHRPIDVAIVVGKAVRDSDLSWLRGLRDAAASSSPPRCVLIANNVHMLSPLNAVNYGIAAVLPRQGLERAHLLQVVLSVSQGAAHLPPAMQGELLMQIDRVERDLLAPKGLTMFGIATRERDILRLLADGLDTAEVAAKLAYSERTVKHVLHALMTRFNLDTRAHAVAFAIRAGII